MCNCAAVPTQFLLICTLLHCRPSDAIILVTWVTLKIQMMTNWQIWLRIWYHKQHHTLSQHLSSKRQWDRAVPPYFAIWRTAIFFERADPASQPLYQVFTAARNSQYLVFIPSHLIRRCFYFLCIYFYLFNFIVGLFYLSDWKNVTEALLRYDTDWVHKTTFRDSSDRKTCELLTLKFGVEGVVFITFKVAFSHSTMRAVGLTMLGTYCQQQYV